MFATDSFSKITNNSGLHFWQASDSFVYTKLIM